MTATISATRFCREFAAWQRRVQREPIEVRNHETVTGYYISADEYARLKRRDKRALATEDLPDWLIERVATGEVDPNLAPPDEAG